MCGERQRGLWGQSERPGSQKGQLLMRMREAWWVGRGWALPSGQEGLERDGKLLEGMGEVSEGCHCTKGTLKLISGSGKLSQESLCHLMQNPCCVLCVVCIYTPTPMHSLRGNSKAPLTANLQYFFPDTLGDASSPTTRALSPAVINHLPSTRSLWATLQVWPN